MYRIIKDGVTVGLTEAPTYVRKQENGCFALCAEPEAQGIAHGGTVYGLVGRDPVEGLDTVVLELTDAGAHFEDIQSAIDDLVIASLEGGVSNV